jgi:hypothetical protein
MADVQGRLPLRSMLGFGSKGRLPGRGCLSEADAHVFEVEVLIHPVNRTLSPKA